MASAEKISQVFHGHVLNSAVQYTNAVCESFYVVPLKPKFTKSFKGLKKNNAAIGISNHLSRTLSYEDRDQYPAVTDPEKVSFQMTVLVLFSSISQLSGFYKKIKANMIKIHVSQSQRRELWAQETGKDNQQIKNKQHKGTNTKTEKHRREI